MTKRNPDLACPMIARTDCYSDNPVVSPVDGTVINSRRSLREHNARNGVVDIGNDRAAATGASKSDDYAADRDLERDINKAWSELDG